MIGFLASQVPAEEVDGEFKIGARRAEGKGMKRLGPAVLLIVLLTGCGSSSSTTGSGTASSPSSPAASPSVSPATRPQLEAIVLQTGDVPTGWTSKPYEANPTADADEAALATCVGVPSTADHKVADANSADFALGDASISSSATSYQSQSDLDVDVAMLNNPKLSPCYDQMLKKGLAASLPDGSTLESASFTVTPGSAGGPANIIATGAGTGTVTVSDQKVTFFVSVAFITGPLMEATVNNFSIGEPFPAAVEKSLFAAVATRAAKG
jgi:hypothetical protein